MAKSRKQNARKLAPHGQLESAQDDYDVGYGKPPAEHQFKPGQSGNRRGRPSGRINIATALREAVQQKRSVTVAGRPREMSTLDVILRKQIEKAVAGDTKAFHAVVDLLEAYAPDLLAAVTQKSVSQEDLDLLSDYTARQSAAKRPEIDDPL